jgi:hypothetical protein
MTLGVRTLAARIGAPHAGQHATGGSSTAACISS